jgi:hypothetical protein
MMDKLLEVLTIAGAVFGLTALITLDEVISIGYLMMRRQRGGGK